MAYLLQERLMHIFCVIMSYVVWLIEREGNV